MPCSPEVYTQIVFMTTESTVVLEPRETAKR